VAAVAGVNAIELLSGAVLLFDGPYRRMIFRATFESVEA
jgi:hypothetical protein